MITKRWLRVAAPLLVVVVVFVVGCLSTTRWGKLLLHRVAVSTQTRTLPAIASVQLIDRPNAPSTPRWEVDGLHVSSKNMAVLDNLLLVVDNRQIIELDVATGKEVRRIPISELRWPIRNEIRDGHILDGGQPARLINLRSGVVEVEGDDSWAAFRDLPGNAQPVRSEVYLHEGSTLDGPRFDFWDHGQRRWASDLKGRSVSSQVVTDKHVFAALDDYVETKNDGLYAMHERTGVWIMGLDFNTGAAKWSFRHPADAWMLGHKDERLVMRYDEAHPQRQDYGSHEDNEAVAVLDGDTGGVRWVRRGLRHLLASCDDGLLFLQENGAALIDDGTGNTRWSVLFDRVYKDDFDGHLALRAGDALIVAFQIKDSSDRSLVHLCSYAINTTGH